MRTPTQIRRAVQSVDPDQPIANDRTMEELIAQSVGQRRLSMLLLSLFSGIALVLASVGIYGLMSYSVAQRSRELGVRIALGAARSDVLRLVLRQGMSLALIGIVIGVGAAFALTRLIESQLYGVRATDPATFVAWRRCWASPRSRPTWCPRSGPRGWIRRWCCARSEPARKPGAGASARPQRAGASGYTPAARRHYCYPTLAYATPVTAPEPDPAVSSWWMMSPPSAASRPAFCRKKASSSPKPPTARGPALGGGDTGGVSMLVSDIVMPRLNGVELLQVSRAPPAAARPADVGLRRPGARGHGDRRPVRILAKPFAPERLVEELRRCLGAARSPRCRRVRGCSAS